MAFFRNWMKIPKSRFHASFARRKKWFIQKHGFRHCSTEASNTLALKKLPKAQRAQSIECIDSINTFISKQKLQQSKHLKGQLDPPVSDGQVFGSKVVSWTPLLVTVTFLDQRLSVGPPNYSIKKSMWQFWLTMISDGVTDKAWQGNDRTWVP